MNAMSAIGLAYFIFVFVFLMLVTFNIWPFNGKQTSGYRQTGELPDAVRPPRQEPVWDRSCPHKALARRPKPTPAPPKDTYCHHCGVRQRTDH